MASCDEDFGADLTLIEVDARGRAGSLKWQLDRRRSKLKAAVEEAKDVRRAAKNALSLQAEVTRLEKLLSEASIESAKRRPITKADEDRRRLRATLERAENQKTTIKSLRTERGELRKEVTRLNREVARLGKRLAREQQASEKHKETIRRQYDQDIQLRAVLRRLHDRSDRVRSLSDEVFWLRLSLDVAKGADEKLTARVAKLRAVGATLSKLPVDEAACLRNVLRRSRRQKAAIKSLSRENARLRRTAKASQTRIEKLEAQHARLRASAAVLQKALFGSRSEQQEKPRSERKPRTAARRSRPWAHPAACA